MKIQKNTSNKPLFLALTVIIILLTVVCIYFFMNHEKSSNQQKPDNSGTTNKVDYSPPTKEQVNPSTDPADPPQTGDGGLDVKISSANQVSGSLQIRSLISPFIASGSCRVTLNKQGSTSVERSSGVQSLSNSSTCQGFDIPISLLSPGNWTISLVVTSGRAGGSAERNILIQ